MPEESVPAIAAPPLKRDNPFTRSVAGMIGMAFLGLMLAVCLGSLPWTLGVPAGKSGPRYNEGTPAYGRLPPSWVTPTPTQRARLNAVVDAAVVERVARDHAMSVQNVLSATSGPAAEALSEHWPRYFLGTDVLGRSLLLRCLAGGGLSLGIGLAAALLSVFIGTVYGAVAGYAGGTADALMMRVVDVLYGLPYVLLVVLLAVAGDALIGEYVARNKERAGWVHVEAAAIATQRGLTSDDAARELLEADTELRKQLETRAAEALPAREMSTGARRTLDVVTLLVAIGGLSWLTMSRVIRGQVLSLKNQPFVEAARAVGVPLPRLFRKHLLPNLAGPIIVYATLTVPQAMLQESFLSFLGIGVKPPLPSWGNLAADGLEQLNSYDSNWWLLLFPCLLLGSTLLALNFVGEGLREAIDPKRARR
ncbi:MAG TPA: ABC transporter permease [Phycisphaerales bacterium]|nr:ABC transporter permease [Phycisphaerales bacterium]